MKTSAEVLRMEGIEMLADSPELFMFREVQSTSWVLKIMYTG